MTKKSVTQRPDPRPTDHRHSLPADVAQRSSASAELSVIAGLGFAEGETV